MTPNPYEQPQSNKSGSCPPRPKSRPPTIGSRERLCLIESFIHNWQFAKLAAWAEPQAGRRSCREELLICYAWERSGELEKWQQSINRLRQRVLRDESELMAKRALCLVNLKDLMQLGQDLKRGVIWDDLLYQVALVRLADRLAALGQLEEAANLYNLYVRSSICSEWESINELKTMVLRYLTGRYDDKAILASLTQSRERWSRSPLAYTLSLAFELYIWNTASLFFEHLDLHNQLRRSLDKLGTTLDQTSPYTTVISCLLNPERGISEVLLKSQLPDTSIPASLVPQHSPELLWLTDFYNKFRDIQEGFESGNLVKLRDAISIHKRQGNHLLLACARSRILSFLLHEGQLHPESTLTSLWLSELELLSQMPHCELKSFAAILRAAYLYRGGHFQDSLQSLRLAKRLSKDHQRKSILSMWLAHAQGRMLKNASPSLATAAHNLLMYFFAPYLKVLGESLYLVNEFYRVDLQPYPVLNRLLRQVMRHPRRALAIHDVQNLVWRQTASLEGWKQKLRNAVFRLRYQFRFMMAPLLIHSQGQLRLNFDSHTFLTKPPKSQAIRLQKVLAVLQQGRHSLEELRGLTDIPSSTLRRDLQVLIRKGQIRVDIREKRAFFTFASSAGSKD